MAPRHRRGNQTPAQTQGHTRTLLHASHLPLCLSHRLLHEFQCLHPIREEHVVHARLVTQNAGAEQRWVHVTRAQGGHREEVSDDIPIHSEHGESDNEAELVPEVHHFNDSAGEEAEWITFAHASTHQVRLARARLPVHLQGNAHMETTLVIRVMQDSWAAVRTTTLPFIPLVVSRIMGTISWNMMSVGFVDPYTL